MNITWAFGSVFVFRSYSENKNIHQSPKQSGYICLHIKTKTTTTTKNRVNFPKCITNELRRLLCLHRGKLKQKAYFYSQFEINLDTTTRAIVFCGPIILSLVLMALEQG